MVSQALVVGDRRPYLVALITLDEDEVEKLEATGRSRRRSSSRPSRAINGDLARFEQIRRYTILPRDFSAEQNEVTPTLKLKRKIVEEHFAAELEQLYEA